MGIGTVLSPYSSPIQLAKSRSCRQDNNLKGCKLQWVNRSIYEIVESCIEEVRGLSEQSELSFNLGS
jgi:hypothetical protein